MINAKLRFTSITSIFYFAFVKMEIWLYGFGLLFLLFDNFIAIGTRIDAWSIGKRFFVTYSL
jgi:hypothetical protein